MPNPRRQYFVVLALCLAMVGCDREEATSSPATTSPPPATVHYPPGAAHATYTYYDESGRAMAVRDFADVPEAVHDLAMVSIGEKTRPPDGQAYVLDRSASSDRAAAASLRDEELVRKQSEAAWSAYDHGFTSLDTAIAIAANSEVAGHRQRRKRGSKKPARARARDTKRLKPKSAKTLEIVGISSGSSSNYRRRSRKSGKATAAFGWKPVTMYMTQTCGVCRRARRWLEKNSVPYTEKDLDANPAAHAQWSRVCRKAGLGGGVPTFVIGKERKVMQGWDSDRFVQLARR